MLSEHQLRMNSDSEVLDCSGTWDCIAFGEDIAGGLHPLGSSINQKYLAFITINPPIHDFVRRFL